MANRYKEGKGFFVFPWTRSQATENLLKQAAEGGSPKAMMEYFGLLRAKNDLAEARYWLVRAAETGYESGVYAYGYFLAVEPEALGFKADFVKGYALISLLKELDGGGGVLKFVDLVLPEIESKMTALQITEAEKFSSEWKKTHPPLSFFPPKLGF
ncbi:sel1 repeat family protein [Pseudomonas chlororaphis subsp. piscium]|nr:sel1 repeat family protein [Pseudomonas chlororaphis subsp. piscium]